MQWDANGDGHADTSATAGPSNAFPTMLKLVRNGATFTGSYSIDNGKTWNAVATATVADAASTQDAGMFQSSHQSGVVTRGDFSEFKLS